MAGWLAPVPGGVGPMTRAMLLAKVVAFAERAGLSAGAPFWPGALLASNLSAEVRPGTRGCGRRVVWQA